MLGNFGKSGLKGGLKPYAQHMHNKSGNNYWNVLNNKSRRRSNAPGLKNLRRSAPQGVYALRKMLSNSLKQVHVQKKSII